MDGDFTMTVAHFSTWPHSVTNAGSTVLLSYCKITVTLYKRLTGAKSSQKSNKMYTTDEIELIRERIASAYKRPLLNEEGQCYGHVYSDTLDNEAKGCLEYGFDGTLQRSVWEQIWYE